MIEFLQYRHKGQFRDGTNEEYWNHPYRVAKYLFDNFIIHKSTELYQVALFHDILEDTECPHNLFIEKFGKKVYDAVMLLTKGDNKDTYYKKILEYTTLEPYSGQYTRSDCIKLVKICDRIDNLKGMENWKTSRIEKKILETEQYIIPIAKSLRGLSGRTKYIEEQQLRNPLNALLGTIEQTKANFIF